MNAIILTEIINRLQALNPYKVILFGSHANGKANEDSDVDLFIVLKDDVVPTSFREKKEIYLKVSRLLRDIAFRVPLDLIVQTKAEYEKFIAAGSLFCQTITKQGKQLL